jgi:hypothetical protein
MEQQARCGWTFLSRGITQPWQARLEQKIVTFTVASGAGGLGIADDDRPTLAFALWQAQPFLWRDDICRLAINTPLPPHVIGGDLMPFPILYCTFEHGWELAAVDEEGTDVLAGAQMYWELYYNTETHIEVFTHLMGRQVKVGDARIKILRMTIPFGSKFPDDFTESERPAIGRLLKMLAFLRSPYCVAENHKLPRPIRRGGQIKGPELDSFVSVVTLRRESKRAVQEYESASHDYKHQWWVAGHFRNQWYARRKLHEMIWIAPYLKGPNDAPILDKVYTVAR